MYLKIKRRRKKTKNKIIEISFYARGGQTAVTASQLLAKMAYVAGGIKDVLSIPIIGAERRGAPIQAFTKLSKEKEIKVYSSVINPDYVLIFDTSLLNIQKVKDSIKKETTFIINSSRFSIKNLLPQNSKIYIVDATGICVNRNLIKENWPILNVPMLGAFGKVSGYYDLQVMEKVLGKKFQKSIKQNLGAAKESYESVVLMN